MYKHARTQRLLIHERLGDRQAALREATLVVRGLARSTPSLFGPGTLDLLEQRLRLRGFDTTIARWIRDELEQAGCVWKRPPSQPEALARTGRGAARARRRSGQFGGGNWRPIEKALRDLSARTAIPLATKRPTAHEAATSVSLAAHAGRREATATEIRQQ